MTGCGIDRHWLSSSYIRARTLGLHENCPGVIMWLLDIGSIDFEETDVACVGEASNFIHRERLSKYHEIIKLRVLDVTFSGADKLSFVDSTVLIPSSLYPYPTLFSQTLIMGNRQVERWCA